MEAFSVNHTSFSDQVLDVCDYCWPACSMWPLTELDHLANPFKWSIHYFLRCLKQSNPAFWNVKLQTSFIICMCFFLSAISGFQIELFHYQYLWLNPFVLTCESALISNLLVSGGNSLSIQTFPAGLLTMAAFLAEFLFSFAHITKVTVNTCSQSHLFQWVFRALFWAKLLERICFE